MTSLRDISAAVCSAYGVDHDDLHGPSHARAIAYPRFAAFHLAREVRGYPLPQIAKHFGGRHHTTVMHGVDQAERLLKDDSFSAKYHLAKALIGSKRAMVFHSCRA